ncbi:MAG: hypothetical protein IKN65_02185 [Clostridia bacterium]|nr:hypothetical protein [Clostridia bacterium]
MSKKKKTIIITAVVLAAFIIMGVVYALFSDKLELINKFKVGTVRIDTKELALTDKNGNNAALLSPADIDTLSWTTENLGTSGVLTRHTLEIRWSGDLNFYLYPANMAEDKILADFNNIQNGLESKALTTEPITETAGGVTKVVGMKYNFVGDVLDGSNNNDQNSVSSEVNYNSTDESIIDTAINTDDTAKKEDKVAFRLLLSPKTSYLEQGKIISIKVKTEGMQYTEDGSGTWVEADVEEIQ